MKKIDSTVEAVKEMVAEMAGLSHISATEESMLNAGGLMFSVFVTAQRNGAQIWAKIFHCSKAEKLVPMLLAAALYDLWPKKCMSLFAVKTPSKQTEVWTSHSATKMLKAVEKVVANKNEIHPAVMQLTASTQSRINILPKPIDMHIDDIKRPLKMAIKKGASREDLIRLVDEAIAESVMRA